jgi:hypothetical protein
MTKLSPVLAAVPVMALLGIADPSDAQATTKPPFAEAALSSTVPDLPNRRSIAAAEAEGITFPRDTTLDSVRVVLLPAIAAWPSAAASGPTRESRAEP